MTKTRSTLAGLPDWGRSRVLEINTPLYNARKSCTTSCALCLVTHDMLDDRNKTKTKTDDEAVLIPFLHFLARWGNRWGRAVPSERASTRPGSHPRYRSPFPSGGINITTWDLGAPAKGCSPPIRGSGALSPATPGHLRRGYPVSGVLGALWTGTSHPSP